MSHEVNFPDYLWRLAQQASGMSNPASWIRDRIGELLTGHSGTHSMDKLGDAIVDFVNEPDEPNSLPALGIYAKTDRENFIAYYNAECAGDETIAVKALASKDNPTAFLQWWADKQTSEHPAPRPAPEVR